MVMAKEKLKSKDSRGYRTGRRKYPWEKWLKKKTLKLKRGKDFDINPKIMAQAFYNRVFNIENKKREPNDRLKASISINYQEESINIQLSPKPLPKRGRKKKEPSDNEEDNKEETEDNKEKPKTKRGRKKKESSDNEEDNNENISNRSSKITGQLPIHNHSGRTHVRSTSSNFFVI